MKWNAFLMVRNEEDMIVDTISCIKSQSIPPENIYIFDDGSTDSTVKLLEDMDGITLIRLPIHADSELASKPFTDRRIKARSTTIADVDYVLQIDADVSITPKYAEDIIKNMRADNVAVAVGFDVNMPIKYPLIDSCMMIDVKRVFKHKTDIMSSSHVTTRSLLYGYSCATYFGIKMTYKRKQGQFYTKHTIRLRGENLRKHGIILPVALWGFVRMRSLQYLLGYLTYKGYTVPPPFKAWHKDFITQRMRQKLGLKTWMFKKTDRGLFILPKPKNLMACP